MKDAGKRQETKGGRALAATELDSSDDVGIPNPDVVEPEDVDEDPLIGKVLSGLYKVDRKIGEGGMGTVYRAQHIHLNKPFAIKVLSTKIAQNHSAVERLRQEAVAASHIDHEHIVQVVNFDKTDDGDVFIVMELLEGKSLADLLERGALGIPKSIEIATQICRALEAAHNSGIVHRDLKPENIHIVRKADRDFVKVLDFGISKVKIAEAEEVRMTKTGQLVGTPLYMSPEQAKGEADIDRRADVYALGVLLYEMLCGEPPFDGGNYFQLLWKHGNEDPVPLRERTPESGIPEALEAVVLKALAKHPVDRHQSMVELEAELLAAVPDIESAAHIMSLTPSTPVASARPSTQIELPTSKRGPLLGLVAGAIAILALGIGIAVASNGGDERVQPTPPPPVVEPEVNDPPDEPSETIEIEELPQGVEPPEQFTMHFVSRPPGATVLVDGRELGATPLTAPLPASETALEVVFRLPRHEDETVQVIPADDGRIEAVLRRVRQPGQGSIPGLKMTF